MPYPAKLNPETILNAAQSLLEEGGPEALNMRSLAEGLSVRPSSLYRHYPGREGLLCALEQRAMLALRQALEAASQGLLPREALVAAAHAYLRYARLHPHLYALLLTPACGDPAQQASGKRLWNTLLALVGALSGHPDDTDHAVAFWTFLHGFAVLERSGMFGESGPRGGLQVGLDALLDHMAEAGRPA
ncbi:TetR/AcrR family transcriptional regulator [Deinococcus metallilatus]|uniref:AcrR family transcriptional regulator n=1 Tax=Deinococcus metallilatus TaxID=1211322 RepID=A0AAJ5F2R8_9DEIO|nr:TetR/AcrR family transcriptional regulator [Deinococcus metallilatus]MBB5295069.1 AcrR family transcriptional regulator [Deinococcus metallilatus]QBY08750.1 TetR/AcrR family transcriptional regulator [Deinococcus metallilatus]RXJ10630.1 TetR/AcrR family transcriptional regulator [Deinococcus metallilatus]TLK26601.1 TetR/AcrR family transcriptional regulator [Deinococcus metallilatus]GMA14841.1 TetR family transcriptional regulator [Deinococcus metallilatus]